MTESASAVDLFCGAGGLTRGLLDADHNDVEIRVRAGFDLEAACEYPYTANNEGAEFVEEDLSRLLNEDDEFTSETVDAYFGDAEVKILAGCAPCQPFSPLNRAGGEDHDKWGLLRAFSKLVVDIEPDVVTMENVPPIRGHSVYEEFVDTLRSAGYSVDADTLYCPDYGIPQTRSRLVLVASRLGEIELPDETHTEAEYETVESWLGGLDEIGAGEQHPEDRLHKTRGLMQRNVDRWEASNPGGTWRDWPEELVLDCHKKESGQSYDSVYGIMEPDQPAPTVTTQFYNYGSGRFGHPTQPRALSLREGAMLQTFPQDYEFVPADEDVTMKNIGRLIGNAVPVRLGQVVGETIQAHLAEH